jgi:hypothetical protein
VIDKEMMVLQNYTNLEDIVLGLCGETYPTSDAANQAMNVKAEEVSDIKEEEDPVPITFQKIKAEPQVSWMSVCVCVTVRFLLQPAVIFFQDSHASK